MITYKRHRFPPAIISYAVWLYHRFNLSHRDIEDLLAERGIAVSYEAIRLWCAKFGPEFTRRIVTDKLRSYGVAHRELMPDVVHDNAQCANNRAELSHQPTRVRERGMRRIITNYSEREACPWGTTGIYVLEKSSGFVG
jgi:transposase-like protein